MIFLDESDARKVAQLYQLPKTGVIGLLIRARLDGKVSSLRQELDRLRHEGGFWIGEKLYQQALMAVGEGGSVAAVEPTERTDRILHRAYDAGSVSPMDSRGHSSLEPGL